MHVPSCQYPHLADLIHLRDNAAHFTADDGQGVPAAGIGQPQLKGTGADPVQAALRQNVVGGGQGFQNGGDGALGKFQQIGDFRQAQSSGIGVNQLQNPENPQRGIVIFHCDVLHSSGFRFTGGWGKAKISYIRI